MNRNALFDIFGTDDPRSVVEPLLLTVICTGNNSFFPCPSFQAGICLIKLTNTSVSSVYSMWLEATEPHFVVISVHIRLTFGKLVTYSNG